MSFTDDRVNLVLPDNNEKGFEVFYNAAVTPWFELSADLQVLDRALRTSTNIAWVTGLRGRISF